MEKFSVRIQVIKVYDVEVEAEDKEEAVDAAYGLSSTEIEERGELSHVETDHAEVKS